MALVQVFLLLTMVSWDGHHDYPMDILVARRSPWPMGLHEVLLPNAKVFGRFQMQIYKLICHSARTQKHICSRIPKPELSQSQDLSPHKLSSNIAMKPRAPRKFLSRLLTKVGFGDEVSTFVPSCLPSLESPFDHQGQLLGNRRFVHRGLETIL